MHGCRQKPNTRWSEEETALLVDAVCVRGTGSWADILEQHRATFHPTRSSVDLKDKWRNLVKVPALLFPWRLQYHALTSCLISWECRSCVCFTGEGHLPVRRVHV